MQYAQKNNINLSILLLLFYIFFFIGTFFITSQSYAFIGEKTSELQLLETKNVFDKEDSKKRFQGKQFITRGEFLKWTLRNAGFSEKRFLNGKEPFQDIKKNQKIFPFVASAYASGALDQYEHNKKFLPQKKISRLEAMKILFAIEGISTFQKYSKNTSKYKDLPINEKDKAILLKSIQEKYLILNRQFLIFPKRKLTKDEVVHILAKISEQKRKTIVSQKISPIEKTEKIILQKSLYKNKVSHRKLEEKALKGMMESLGDPYSVYMPPKSAREFSQYINGNNNYHKKSSQYVGIGISVLKKKTGGLIITEIFDGPAKKANLLVGDEILKVNGEDISHLKTHTITDKIKGREGTFVELLIKRNNNKNILKKIKRGKITLKNYKNIEVNIKENILWLKIRGFKSHTAQDFAKILEKNLNTKKNIKGLVIDLRYNPGGLLNASRKMLGEILPKNHIVVRMKNLDGENVIKVSGSGKFTKIPIIVVQNEYSASASEIFSGSIQDYKRGIIIGKKSFGKGVAQNLYALPNGGEIKLTTNEFFTPLGKKVNKIGIIPDIIIQKTDEESIWNVVKRIMKNKQKSF